MTSSAHYPATLSRLCFFLLLSHISAACPQQQEVSPPAATTIALGTYRLQPLTSAQLLQDFAPEYRLVSAQEHGYIISTDTGLSYVVDGTGKVTQVDQSDTSVSEHTRVWAATEDAVWLVTATQLWHSKGQNRVAIADDEVRVLWFSARQILLWGKYQRDGGTSAKGLQLYSLDASDRVVVTQTIGAELIREQASTFAGAEKFIAAGVIEQGFWLWTRDSGLLLMRERAQNSYEVEDRTVISLPRIDGKVFKDIGFTLDMTGEEITPPAYVLGIAAGEGNRGSLYIAAKTP